MATAPAPSLANAAQWVSRGLIDASQLAALATAGSQTTATIIAGIDNLLVAQVDTTNPTVFRAAVDQLFLAAASSPPVSAAAAPSPPPPTPASPASPPAPPTPAAAAAVPAATAPRECVAICIDRSGSMGSPFEEMRAWGDNAAKTLANRSRMDAVKQIFYAFRDRTETLEAAGAGDGGGGGAHELGLLQFDDRIDEMLGLTSDLALFEAIVDDVRHRSMTAIYSAIVAAAAMLKPRFDAAASATDLRVLVLTDGDNNTGADPRAALKAVNEIGAVVDAIVVGDTPDENLRRIVQLTGGECWQITALSEGFQLMEAESAVSLHARRGGVPKPAFVRRPTPADFGAVAPKAITRGTAVRRPRPKAVPQRVVDARAAASLSSSASFRKAAAAAAGGGARGAAAKRVMKELKQVAAADDRVWLHSGEGVHVFPDADDVTGRWRALIEGPRGSPFEGGVFALTVTIPANYPFAAPRIEFETPVYHCNVSDHGRICLALLHDRWAPTLSIPKALEAVRLMLAQPDTDDALRQWIAELTIAHTRSAGADTRYAKAAQAATAHDAGRTVDEWKAQWAVASTGNGGGNGGAALQKKNKTAAAAAC